MLVEHWQFAREVDWTGALKVPSNSKLFCDSVYEP